MKATIVWIHTNTEGDYIVPPIVPGSDFYKSKTSLDALHYAQWQAELYNQKTGRVKFPSLAGDTYLPRAKVEVGEKARERLGINDAYRNAFGRNIFEFAIHNMIYLRTTPMSTYGAWFGTIFRNGEWASICTSETRPNTPRQEIMWSNFRVLKMKELMHFPENPYIKKSTLTPDPALSGFFSDRMNVTNDAMTALTKAIKQAGANLAEATDNIRIQTRTGRPLPDRPRPYPVTIEEDPVTGQLHATEHRGEYQPIQEEFVVDPAWFATPHTLVEIDGNNEPIPPGQFNNDNPHGIANNMQYQFPMGALDILDDPNDDEDDFDMLDDDGDDDE